MNSTKLNKKFNLSKVEYSKNDIKSNIRIPEKLCVKLAEFLGIMIGDGHIGCYVNKKGKSTFKHYELRIAGNIKDYTYHENYLNNLIFDIFNIKFHLRTQKERNVVILSKDSKALFYFLYKVIGIPTRKDYVEVPSCILNEPNKMQSSFLRGLADADFCLTISPKGYPRVIGASKSKILIEQVSEILTELGIQNCFYREEAFDRKRDVTYIRSRLYINGVKRVKKFIDIVGFSNPNKTKKFLELYEK